MHIKILIDNISRNGLISEWGLSIYIEYGAYRILLDTGQSAGFMENAASMGIDMEQIDFGVLSHAHFDHADGLAAFFEKNKSAKFYLRAGSAENCYSLKPGADMKGLLEDSEVINNPSLKNPAGADVNPGNLPAVAVNLADTLKGDAGKGGFKTEGIVSDNPSLKYIGISRGYLEKYHDRIVYVDGDYEIVPGVMLLPHKTRGLEKIGEKEGLFVDIGGHIRPDNFSHEQSLVFDTERGLVILNSCSHAGPGNIIREVSSARPGREIYALIGGLHLFKTSEEDVRALAREVKATGISRLYTGHCTGDKAFAVLKEELDSSVMQIYTGMDIHI